MGRLKFLTAAVLVAALSVTAASAFTDTQGHPSEAAIDKWSMQYGIISGYGDNTFHPNDSITKGAFCGIIDRMMHYRSKSPPTVFRDVAGTYWEDAILKLHANAVVRGDDNGNVGPSAPVTRQQAVTMIARTFDFAADSIFPHYVDDVNIDGYARSTVSEMTERGYLEGVADDYFRPAEPITRADVVRIFDNIITLMVQNNTPVSQNVNGNVLINSQNGATLSNMYITGTLYVASGVVGPVVLENVNIGGEIKSFSLGLSIERRATSTPPVLPEPEEDPGDTQKPPTPVTPVTPDDGQSEDDSGETTAPVVKPAPATPDNGYSEDDSGETTAPVVKPTPDSGDTAPTTPSNENPENIPPDLDHPGENPENVPPDIKPDYPTMYDPGETTAPVVRPTPSNPDSGRSDDSGETTAPHVTPVTPSGENPENIPPDDTPVTPVTPVNPEPVSPGTATIPKINYGAYGTLPTNKPVSSWTISDIYSPTATSGSFTFEGSRIPIYKGVKTRNVYSGDFTWRSGHRLRYGGGRYNAWFGVDVSAYQNRDRDKGTINWTAAKADGVQFAMIRVGLRGTSTGSLREDAYYARNIDGAMAAGIQTGVYIFAQAVTIQEAIEEADFVIARLRGHTINGPVSYDWEMKDSSYRVYGTSKEMATACAVAFCKRIAAAGYTPMVYNSRYVAYVKYDQGALAPYMMWYPQYPSTSVDYPFPNLYYQMDFWQFTDSATVEGIGKNIDANIWFRPKS